MRPKKPKPKDVLIARSVKTLSDFCETLLARSEELASQAEALKRLLIRYRYFSPEEFADELQQVRQSRAAKIAEIRRQHMSKALDSLLRQLLSASQTTKTVH